MMNDYLTKYVMKYSILMISYDHEVAPLYYLVHD